MDFRALRLWHWQRAMAARKAANTHRNKPGQYNAQQTKANDGRANFHIKAVQVLNDAPGCQGTTAEQDEDVNKGRANAQHS